MRQVFKNFDELIRMWISQKQDEGKVPSSFMYFKDKIIYSYGDVPLAMIVNKYKSLLTITEGMRDRVWDRKIRVESMLRRKGFTIIEVPIIDIKNFEDHKLNIEFFLKKIKKYSVKFKKSRSRYEDYYQNIVMNIVDLFCYCEVFCIKTRSKDILKELNKPDLLKMTRDFEVRKIKDIMIYGVENV